MQRELIGESVVGRVSVQWERSEDKRGRKTEERRRGAKDMLDLLSSEDSGNRVLARRSTRGSDDGNGEALIGPQKSRYVAGLAASSTRYL